MYVDDGYAITNSTKFADQEIKALHAKFKLSRKGPEYFLGNNIHVLGAPKP